MKVLYEVPIIPNNLRVEETIVQIADMLDYLSNVFDDIITRVNERVDENSKKVSSLKKRVDVSATKINKIMETKKAIQVFSSSKYPAVDVYKNYKSLFDKNKNNVVLKRNKIKFKNLALTEQPLEKLMFYHVKLSDKLNQHSNYVDTEAGLGVFPNDIESVSELLLYNTSTNPYKNYVVADPLHSFPNVKVADEITLTRPDDAPLSISHRAATNRLGGENYFYSPDLGDVPSIDVPMDLPDLPGIADDLRYIMESGPAIAPSVTTTPVLTELPAIVESSNDNVPQSKPSEEIEVHAPKSLPEVGNTVNEVEMYIPETTPQVQPEPDIPQPEIPPAKKETEKTPSALLPNIGVARASLMEAIRQAGGAKKANLRIAQPKQEEKSVTGGNSLMDDLHAKLAMRRKGISGAKASKGYEVSAAMNSVSAMIPPPQLSNELNESTNTEDEDWDE